MHSARVLNKMLTQGNQQDTMQLRHFWRPLTAASIPTHLPTHPPAYSPLNFCSVILQANTASHRTVTPMMLAASRTQQLLGYRRPAHLVPHHTSSTAVAARNCVVRVARSSSR
jgi:hypothetical protein